MRGIEGDLDRGFDRIVGIEVERPRNEWMARVADDGKREEENGGAHRGAC